MKAKFESRFREDIALKILNVNNGSEMTSVLPSSRSGLKSQAARKEIPATTPQTCVGVGSKILPHVGSLDSARDL